MSRHRSVRRRKVVHIPFTSRVEFALFDESDNVILRIRKSPLKRAKNFIEEILRLKT